MRILDFGSHFVGSLIDLSNLLSTNTMKLTIALALFAAPNVMADECSESAGVDYAACIVKLDQPTTMAETCDYNHKMAQCGVANSCYPAVMRDACVKSIASITDCAESKCDSGTALAPGAFLIAALVASIAKIY